MNEQPNTLRLADELDAADNFYAESSMYFDYKLSGFVSDAADELRRLHALNVELMEALQALYDEQNGPPLIRHEAQWQAAMDAARAALKKVGASK